MLASSRVAIPTRFLRFIASVSCVHRFFPKQSVSCVRKESLSTNLEVAQKRCDHAATWAVAEDF